MYVIIKTEIQQYCRSAPYVRLCPSISETGSEPTTQFRIYSILQLLQQRPNFLPFSHST